MEGLTEGEIEKLVAMMLQIQAVRAVALAVRKGALPAVTAIPCIGCGQPAKEYHHHKGYEKQYWLDVVPMCKTCHGKTRIRKTRVSSLNAEKPKLRRGRPPKWDEKGQTMAVYLSLEQIQLIRQEASDKGVSVSEVARWAIEEYGQALAEGGAYEAE